MDVNLGTQMRPMLVVRRDCEVVRAALDVRQAKAGPEAGGQPSGGQNAGGSQEPEHAHAGKKEDVVDAEVVDENKK